ncbi:MAG: immunoglobulin-like domain-containing protein, partial [Patescibacteria group bacterium]
ADLGTSITAGEIADGDHGDFTYLGGSATIDANAVALGTDTTGNYVATLADSGAGTLTLSGSGSETAAVTAALNLGNANTWTALQQFTRASSTQLSAYSAYFGGTATTSIDTGGNVTFGGNIVIGGDTINEFAGTGLTVSGNALTVDDTAADSNINSFIHASTTIPKTYTSNTWTGANTFNSTLTIGSLNGPLQANAGVVSATTSVGILYGGTGATTASGARTNLGLAIGTDVQAFDTELAALAGLTSAADSLPYFTGSGTAALTTLTSFIRGLLDDTTAGDARTTLGAAASGANSDITSLSGLTTALSVPQGGTGWGNIQSGAVVYGNGTSALATTSAGTNGYVLALSGGIPTWVATSSINNGVSSLQQTYGSAQTGAVTLATSTQSFNGLTLGTSITNSGSTFTFTPSTSGTLNVAGGGTGLSSVADGQLLFGAGSTVLTALATTSGAGRFLTQDYTTGRPSWVATSSLNINFANLVGTASDAQVDNNLTISGGTIENTPIGAATPSTAIFTNATSTNIAISGQASTSALIVSNTFTLGTLTGFLKATAGVVATATIDLVSDVGSSILAIANGGTGWANLQANTLLLGNGTSRLATTSAGTNGQILSLVSGVPSWVATTTFSTGLTYSAGDVTVNTSQNIATLSNLTSDGVVYTSGGVGTLNVDSGALDVARGGTGLATFGGTNTVLYTSSADTLASTASFVFTGSRLGVGTTTPYATLAVQASGGQTTSLFQIASSSNATVFLSTAADGFGTTTLSGLNISGSATSTSNVGYNITTGCYAINDTCVGGGSGTIDGSGASTRVAFWSDADTLTSSAAFTFDSALSKLTVTNASTTNLSITGGLLDFTTAAATTTVINNNKYAWTIATSTTAAPLFRVDTTSGSEQVVIGSAYGSDVYIGDTGSNSNLVFQEASRYINWAGTSGTLGYGIRDSTGTIQVKNSGGSWSNISTSQWTDGASGSISFTSGWVGIGTTTPRWALTVASSTAPQLALTDGSLTSSQWTFRNAGGNLYLATSSPSTFATSTETALTILEANSNVGVSTTSPFAKLSVAGNLASNSIIPNGTYTNNLSAYDLGASASRWNALWAGTVNIGTSTWSLNNGSDGRLSIYDAASGGGNERISALTTGLVGIGTTTPFAKLAVNPVAGDTNQFVVGSSTATSFIITNTGNVGIDDAAPASRLSIGSGGLLRVSSGGDLSFSGTGDYLVGGDDYAFRYDGDQDAGLYFNVSTQGFEFRALDASAIAHFNASTGLVGIGSTTPFAKLAVNPVAGDVNQFVVGSSTATSFIINNAGNIGIGSTTPNGKVTVTPGATGAQSLYGYSINQPAFWAQTTSARTGYLVEVANASFGANDNGAFQFIYPFDTGASTGKVFRASKGTTLADFFWVDIAGSGYFASDVIIGRTAENCTGNSALEGISLCADGTAGFVSIGEFNINRNDSDGVLVRFRQDGTSEATISIAGNTVTYGAFTGAHYATTSENIPRGMLVAYTGQNANESENAESEPIYGVTLASEKNASNVMGVMLALQEPAKPLSEENPYLIMAVGNGDVWVTQGEEESIEPGDNLITSAVSGHAMKDDGEAFISHVVAKAAQPLDWNTVTAVTQDGKKRAKISIIFEQFDKVNGIALDSLVPETTENTETFFASLESGTLFAGMSVPDLLASVLGALRDLYAVVTENTAQLSALSERFMTREIHITNQLCIGETCITEGELKELLALRGGATASIDVAIPTDTEAPVITLFGNNPAFVAVGATYVDLGASVTDNLNQNLGIHTFIGDAEVSVVTLDTSTSTSYTITYRATDTDGNIGEATRTVVVGEQVEVNGDTVVITNIIETATTTTTVNADLSVVSDFALSENVETATSTVEQEAVSATLEDTTAHHEE